MSTEPRDALWATPPRSLRWLAGLCLPPEDTDALLEDLDDMYRDRAPRGALRARLWYLRQAVGFVTRVGGMRLREALQPGGSLRGDLRVALRQLRLRRAFAVTFVVTLAIGVGIVAAVHTAGRWVLLRPVPGVDRPEELVLLRLSAPVAPPHVSFPLSHPDLLTLRERLAPSALAARTRIDADLRAAGQSPRRVRGEIVTANYFPLLGVRIADGRPFAASEEAVAADEPVVIVSQRLARSLVPGTRVTPGARLSINGKPFRVIGIAPAGFLGSEVPGQSDFWITPVALPVIDPGSDRDAMTARHAGIWQLGILRPSPGVTADAVEAVATGTIAVVRSQFPMHSYVFPQAQFQAVRGAGLDPAVRQSVRTTLVFLALAAGFLLLLTVGNLANLAVIESVRRSAAIGVRIALGARRRHVVRLWTVEGLVLALLAAAIAIPVVLGFAVAFRDLQLSEHGASLAGMNPAPTVALVCLAGAVLVAIVAVAKPALSRNWWQPLRHFSRFVPPEGRLLQRGLVSAQVAMSLALLVLAVILNRTVQKLRAVDLGFSPRNLVTFSMEPHLHGYEGRRLGAFAAGIEQQLRSIDHVRTAGLVSPAPFRSSYVTASLSSGPGRDAPTIVGAGYFATPGILDVLNARILAGRRWSGDSGTVVVTASMWQKLFPGVPIAEAPGRVVFARGKGLRVEAVIADLRLSDLTSDPPPTLFRPMRERYAGMAVSALVATARGARETADDAATIISAGAPDLPLYDVRSVRSAIDLQFAERNAMARVASTFSTIGLFLAAIGLYGVVASIVSTRRREIGVRAAMGASPGSLLRWVMSHALVPVVVGILIGVPAAHAATRILGNRLYGVERFDPGSYAAAAALLLVVSAVAALVPGLSATRVSATEVLRAE